ncbi:hypothetical protein PZN02_004588 [Sinorhizobium garamanticum]|uniref:Uncharacterized protein n=1 Tax=Sinorhizobium garamanticum TaxID=680247 RepID=A0ABY8DKF1_9HYPH|nr:hypothetical protein [Sinorhizobium garamanticum]WEX91374.1 hypothetical protein PZN02_004588 [Sinorhizobium garamanticum]
MRKFGFPISAIVLSTMLVPNFEGSFLRSMTLGMGEPSIFTPDHGCQPHDRINQPLCIKRRAGHEGEDWRGTKAG